MVFYFNTARFKLRTTIIINHLIDTQTSIIDGKGQKHHPVKQERTKCLIS